MAKANRDPRTLLGKGEKVRIEGATFEEAIKQSGPAGFTVENRARFYPWSERGRSWTSATLDRQDAARARFSEAARGPEAA
jgi:hypothetical protein